MKHACSRVLSLVVLLCAVPTHAQSSKDYRDLTRGLSSGRLHGPEQLNEHVTDGKLSLSLHDAILLALENNSDIRIDQAQIESQKFTLLNTYAPFDPLLQSSVNVNRYSSPGYTQLQGVGQSSNATFNQLSQTGQISYTQTFETGTQVIVSASSNKSSTNSSFYFYNPFYSSNVQFQFTQPLLRGAGRFANKAAIIIARNGLAESQANFRAEVSNLILQVVQQYWTAVNARGNLQVNQESLKLAEASYKHDKRALELGALPPLDIYRSQSEFAARRVQVIQSGYAVSQAEDALRLTIGADQDPQIRALPLNLTENPEVADTPGDIDVKTELDQALRNRPEIEASGAALDADRANVRLAHNQLLPNLSLSGFYQSGGLGGNQYNLITGQLISKGGFDSSFNQVFGFGYPGYGGSLTLTLPFRNRAAKATLGTALVAQSHDQYSSRQIREQITRDVSDAVSQLEQAKLAMEAAKTSLDLAQKSLAADQRKYELGAETNFFVLDSQTRLAQTELVLLQTQINYQLARAALSHATGDLLQPYHVQITDLAK
ncbi:MAG TPA: TolC family protein [Acidobacteriaceae bacterium]|nr:TolC family protein [Acidobacteriaceae bacterium]